MAARLLVCELRVALPYVEQINVKLLIERGMQTMFKCILNRTHYVVRITHSITLQLENCLED